jgi:hypothetical protein
VRAENNSKQVFFRKASLILCNEEGAMQIFWRSTLGHGTSKNKGSKLQSTRHFAEQQDLVADSERIVTG